MNKTFFQVNDTYNLENGLWLIANSQRLIAVFLHQPFLSAVEARTINSPSKLICFTGLLLARKIGQTHLFHQNKPMQYPAVFYIPGG